MRKRFAPPQKSSNLDCDNGGRQGQEAGEKRRTDVREGGLSPHQCQRQEQRDQKEAGKKEADDADAITATVDHRFTVPSGPILTFASLCGRPLLRMLESK